MGAVPDIADFYGIGPGQIPGDWRVDDPLLYPGTNDIDRVRNDGGAGALFEISGAKATRQLRYSADLMMATAAGGTAREGNFTPNLPDVAGVHFLMVFRFGSGSTYALAGSDYLVFQNLTTSAGIVSGNLTVLSPDISFPFSASSADAHLIEIRYTNGKVIAYLDGRFLGAEPHDVVSQTIVSLRMSNSWGFGRSISVICTPASDVPEPAVLVAREALAAQYNIAIPITAMISATSPISTASLTATAKWPRITSLLAASDAPDTAAITATARWPDIAATLAASDPPDIAAIAARARPLPGPALRYAYPGDPQGGVLISHRGPRIN